MRRHLLSTLEQAAARHDAGPINVVVAGGGSTGVETSGALTSMTRELGESAARLQVTLMEATRRLLNGFSTRSSRAAFADLRRRGVDVRRGQTIQSANARHVTLGDGEAGLRFLQRMRPRAARLWYGLRGPEFDLIRSDPRFQRLVEESRPR